MLRYLTIAGLLAILTLAAHAAPPATNSCKKVTMDVAHVATYDDYDKTRHAAWEAYTKIKAAAWTKYSSVKQQNNATAMKTDHDELVALQENDHEHFMQWLEANALNDQQRIVKLMKMPSIAQYVSASDKAWAKAQKANDKAWSAYSKVESCAMTAYDATDTAALNAYEAAREKKR